MLPLSRINNPQKTLVKGVEQIKQHHYVLNAGTALGFYRDKDFIPNDTDIDVVILTDKDSVQDITRLEGFRSYLFNNSKWDNKLPVQRAFVDEENGCLFDIYFYYREGDKSVAPYVTHDLVIPTRLYQDRKELETKYGKFFFPSPIEEYLEANYGPDWRTPKEDKGIFNV